MTSSTERFEQEAYRAADSATEILLVRHGASQAFVPSEAFPMLGTQGNPSLSPAGKEQAAKVCDRLRDEPIDRIYVTKLSRTLETAAPLLEATGLTAEVSPHLHELHFGEWEGGLARKKLREMIDPAAIEATRTGKWDLVPGAEKWDAFMARLRTGLEEIVSSNPGSNVVVFAHGITIRAIVAELVDAEKRLSPAENGSISHIVHTDGTWLVRSFNDASHLMSLFTRR